MSIETTFSPGTPAEVREILERFRSSYRGRPRLKLYHGDAETGKPWGDVESGYIGRSTGSVRVPLPIARQTAWAGRRFSRRTLFASTTQTRSTAGRCSSTCATRGAASATS